MTVYKLEIEKTNISSFCSCCSTDSVILHFCILRKKNKQSQPCHMAYTVSPLVELANGERMPIIGFGTWGIFDEQLRTAISTALQVGCRHFDTAFFHGNEDTIGDVLNEWIDGGKVTRSDLFITAKVRKSVNFIKSMFQTFKILFLYEPPIS